jgi:hypothetical protein
MKRHLRSAGAAAGQLGLWPETDSRSPRPGVHDAGAPRHGVGGRQRTRAGRAGGGGYLDGRTGAELRADPRLRELAEIGLQAHWLAVAEIAGYDAFIAAWRRLSADPALRNDDDQIELRLRPFRSFERYQRNRYIDTLVASGMKPSQIHEMLQVDLGERLSYRHIKRLVATSRDRIIGEDRAESQPSDTPPAGTVPA